MKNETIFNAFPEALRKEVEKVIEILPSEQAVLHANGQFYQMSSFAGSHEQIISLDKEILKIPYRIYISEPLTRKEKLLTDLQKTILNCIYLRHNDGFVRQRRLELLHGKSDYFAIAFIIQLLGDYVVEILEVVDKLVNEKNIDLFIRFITENKKNWRLIESRVTSYWNAYYRVPQYPSYIPPKYATRRDYIGQKIVDRINQTKAKQK